MWSMMAVCPRLRKSRYDSFLHRPAVLRRCPGGAVCHPRPGLGGPVGARNVRRVQRRLAVGYRAYHWRRTLAIGRDLRPHVDRDAVFTVHGRNALGCRHYLCGYGHLADPKCGSGNIVRQPSYQARSVGRLCNGRRGGGRQPKGHFILHGRAARFF